MTTVDRSMQDKLPHPGEVPLQVGIKPIHPGIFFLREFLRPRGVEVSAAAEKMTLPVEVLNDFVAGLRPVDVDIANRLGGFTGTRARYWLNMQAAADYGAAHGA